MAKSEGILSGSGDKAKLSYISNGLLNSSAYSAA